MISSERGRRSRSLQNWPRRMFVNADWHGDGERAANEPDMTMLNAEKKEWKTDCERAGGGRGRARRARAGGRTNEVTRRKGKKREKSQNTTGRMSECLSVCPGAETGKEDNCGWMEEF